MAEESSQLVPQNAALASADGSALVDSSLEAWQINQKLEGIVEQIGRYPVIAGTADLGNVSSYDDWFAKVEAGIDPQDDGWWEAFSHGLVMPLDGDQFSEQEVRKGFYERLRKGSQKEGGLVKAFLELETDFLRMDDCGYERTGNTNYPQPLQLHAASAAQSLMLRVVAFSELRKQLAAEGHHLPENPVMQEAIDTVRSYTAREANSPGTGMLADKMHLLGEGHAKPVIKI